MSQQLIDIGVQGNDGTGDSIRESFRKVNSNFTEIYAVFGAGGKIGFTNLSDAPTSYGNSQIIMSNTTGSALTARTLNPGANINIDVTNNSVVTISANPSGLVNDNQPKLIAPLNANGFAIGNVPTPDQNIVNTFNTLWGTSITVNDLVINKGYADTHYVPLTTTTSLSGSSVASVSTALRVRSQPSVPQITDPDYDATLTSNYVSSEAMQRKDTVYRGGDTMTGALVLNDHPSPITGTGPQDSTNRTAATKYYVDQATYSSNVNLFVTTSGDDLQQKSPAGKQGRAWQYAYSSIKAACLAAESLQNIAQIEPGPYRQRVSYTIGANEYFSTIQGTPTLTGGNSAVPGYPDARALLENNKTFIQNEVVSYINNKYVNSFSYNKSAYLTNFINLIDGVTYDLVVGSTYNTTRVTTGMVATTGATSLAQTVDAIEYIRKNIINYSYLSANTSAYITNVINALCYDLIYNSTYNSSQQALLFANANTNLSVTEINAILTNLGNNILGLQATPTISNGAVTTTISGALNGSVITVGSPTGIVTGMVVSGPGIGSGAVVTGISGNIISLSQSNSAAVSGSAIFGTNAIIVSNASGIAAGQLVSGTGIASGSTVSGVVGTVVILNLPLTSTAGGTGRFSISTLAGQNTTATTRISNSVAAIEAALITGSVTTPTFSAITGTTSVGQTSARDLLLNNITFIQSEVVAFLGANYPTLSYSQTKCKRDVQYIIWALVYDIMYGGNTATVAAAKAYWNGVTRQIAASELTATLDAYNYVNTLAQAIITNTSLTTQYQLSIIQYQNTTLTGGSTVSTSVSSNIASLISIINYNTSVSVVQPGTTGVDSTLLGIRSDILGNASTYASNAVTYENTNFPVITDQTTLDSITSLFTLSKNLLNNGITSRTAPTYTFPSGLDSGIQSAVTLVKNNFAFLIDDALGLVKSSYSSTYNTISDTVEYRRQLQYILEGILYDTVYGGGNANVGSIIAANNLFPNTNTATNAAVTRMRNNVALIILNSPVSPTYLSQISSTNTQYTNGSLTNGTNGASRLDGYFAIVSGILGGGTAPSTVYPTLTTYSATLQAARTAIAPNETSIGNTTLTYLDTTYKGGFSYNQATCLRDVGYIIQAMAIDLIVGGTYQSINAGKSYYRNASALLAIGSQYVQTRDALVYAKTVGIQCLNQTSSTRYQNSYSQYFNAGYTSAAQAITDFSNNMDTIISIIDNGIGSAPAPSYGTGIWSIYFNNGGLTSVDQGKAGQNHIIPAKALVGANTGATGLIVNYVPSAVSGQDLIQLRLTQPVLFTSGEQIDFGETVNQLNITIFVESGIYYEDYPIRLPRNTSIKGDEFRRTIIRPKDQVSQSPWRKVFFYRDAVIDANQIGFLDTTYDFAANGFFAGTTANVSGYTGAIQVTLPSSVYIQSSYIGKIITSGDGTNGSAVITSVANNIANCTVINPFVTIGTYASGAWHMYGTINYGRHYLTNPLDITSQAKNNKLMDVFLCNDQVRISNMTFQGHGGFAMVLDPEGQIKTKSPYGQVASSFSRSINAKTFAGGQFVDGFAGRLRGTITGISYGAITGFNTSTTVSASYFQQGSGYTPTSSTATYTNVALTGGTGSGATATITVTNGKVVNVNVAITGSGTGYVVGDLVSCANSSIGGTGSGFSIPISTTSGNGLYVTVQGSTSATGTYVSGGTSTTIVVNNVVGTITNGMVVNSVGSFTTGQTVTGVSTSDNINYTVTLSSGASATPSGTIVFGVSSGLDIRAPQPPCAFYVQGNRYQVDDILSFNASTATVVLVLDTQTPYNAQGNYNNAKCSRDTGLIIDAVLYDMALGSNYQTVKAGLAYLRPESYTVLTNQIVPTIAGITYASTQTQALSAVAAIPAAKARVASGFNNVINLLNQGVVSAAPTITYPAGPSSTTGQQNAVAIIQANRAFIQQEITAYLNANYVVKNIPNYSAVTYQQNVGFAVDAICYDILYGGNSMTFDATIAYFAKSSTADTGFNTIVGQEVYYVAAWNRLNTILQSIVVNTPIAKSQGNLYAQNVSLSAGTSSEQTSINTLVSILTGFSYTTGVTGATRTSPTISGASYTTAQTAITSNKSTIQAAVVTYINAGAQQVINIEMGGNKSMLANDFAMINDLGYAILCTNGGVSEQVSTFSYYCHTHYWANNGGQIRSVAGSNAHGNYGLRASGYDVTELPDSVNIQYDMAQTARVYKQGIYASTAFGVKTDATKSLTLYIIGYQYTPYQVSELEIDHTLAGGSITRYLVSTISHTTVTIGGQNVLQLNLGTSGVSSTSSTGFAYDLYDGQLVQIRILQQALFYNINNVNPTRPSTALQYANNLADVYRVIAYNLTAPTGETLVANTAVLQSDTSFNYYKINTDITSIGIIDPSTSTIAVTGASGTGTVATITFAAQTGLSGVAVTGTGGTFSYTSLQSLQVGQVVVISGTNTGSGTINGSANGTGTYYIIATNGSSTFTLSTSYPGTAIASTVGTTTGLTFRFAPYVVGQSIALNSVNPSGYNGVYTVTAVTTTSVSYASTVNTSYVSGGVIGTQTQGALVGDSKIAVLTISTQSTIDQVNRGLYVFTWNGRSHRIISYTAPVNIATANYVSGGGATTITVTSATYTSTQATLNFASQGSAPFAVGATITVAGMTPSGYNNASAIVVSSTATSVTYTNSTNATITGFGTVASAYIMSVAGVAGTISAGQLVTASSNYTAAGNVTVVSTNLTTTGGSTSGTVVLSGAPAGGLPSSGNTITFGVFVNGYLTIDPNPSNNIAQYGTNINSLSYVSKSIPTSGGTAFVTFDTNWDPNNSPIVDAYYQFNGQPTLTYLNTQQISGASSSSTITVGSTTGLAVGQLVSAATVTLSGVSITGTGGTFTCAPGSLLVNTQIQISGTLSAGSITGYVSTTPTTYYVITTNNSTSFTLSASLGGSAITTTASGGIITGATFIVLNPPNVYVPSGCTITNINTSATQFTVSPAAWIPPGQTVSAQNVGTLASITISVQGSGYSSAPTVTLSGGGATSQAIVTVTINATGNVSGFTVVSPGYGYTSLPTVTVSAPTTGTTAVLIPVLSTTAVTNTVALAGFNSVQATVAYNTDPGVSQINSFIIPSGVQYTSKAAGSYNNVSGYLVTYPLPTQGTAPLVGSYFKVRAFKDYAIATTTSTNLVTIGSTVGLNVGDLITFRTLNFTTTATATNSSGNLITVGSTSGFFINAPVVFSGTNFGNLVAGTVYYVASIASATTMTVSTTQGGSALVVTTTSGTLTAQLQAIPFGNITDNSFFYVTSIVNNTQFTMAITKGSTTNFALTTATGMMVLNTVTSYNPLYGGQYPVQASSTSSVTLFYPYDPATFTYNLSTAVNSQAKAASSATGQNIVNYTITGPGFTPTPGITYTVTGNGTSAYNGTYYSPGGTTYNTLASSTSTSLTVASTSSLLMVVGTNISGSGIAGGTYITAINTSTNVITLSASATVTLNTILTLGNSSTVLQLQYATDPGSSTAAATITLGASAASATTSLYQTNGTTVYLVTWTIPTQSNAPQIGAYYTVAGNSNSNYNGTFKSYASSITSLTLIYSTNVSTPGTTTSNTIIPATSIIGGATTYLISEPTSATSGSLGISKPFSSSTSATLRAGYPAGSAGQITVRISTCRATGHDFLDIGTGSYVTTNYPYQIYGNPAQSRDQTHEILEEGVGRVFYVTSDQNGIFRVGRFFTVDQGTGTVTFSASIALSNLDGLGFKRGVVVSEFSTDSTMTNNASDTVPVQSAVRGYVDARLGLSQGGSPVAASSVIGPGYMALNGTLTMKAAMNLGGFKINNVATPEASGDATNKSYVDTQVATTNALYKLNDQQITNSNITNGSLLVFDQFVGTVLGISGITNPSTNVVQLSFANQTSVPYTVGQTIYVQGVNPSAYNGNWVITDAGSNYVKFASALTNAYVSGGYISTGRWRNTVLPTNYDVTISYSSSTSLLTTTINAGVIVNSQVSTTAAIAQSKLSMRAADTYVSAPGTPDQTVLGLSRFDDALFTASNGWISLRDSSNTSTGIPVSKLRYMTGGYLLGRRTTGSGAVENTGYTPANVVSDGDGIKNALFGAVNNSLTLSGIMAVNYDGSNTGNNTYGVLGISSTNNNYYIVRRDSAGGFVSAYVDATELRVGGSKLSDVTSSTTNNHYTPGGYKFFTLNGTNSADSVQQYLGGTVDFATNAAVLKVTKLTTGAGGTVGFLTGNWQVQSGSTVDVSDGTFITNTLKAATSHTASDSSNGYIQGAWQLTGSSTMQATYAADLAEYYEGDAEYEVGTVLVFGGDKEVTTTNQLNDTRVAGVVSDNAAYRMYGACPGLKNLVALQGRVPCKVVGRVKKGDMLTTSATPGYAVKALTPTLGAIIGKALEDKDYGEAGVIEVAVGRM